MTKKEFDTKYNSLLEEYKIIQNERNELIANQNKNTKISAFVLLVVLVFDFFYMISDAHNINFFNMALLVVPNVIQLMDVSLINGSLKKCKICVTVFLIVIFLILFAALFGSFLIDTGNSFKFSDTAMFLSGIEINKKHLVIPILLNVFIPILTLCTVYTAGDKKRCDANIEVTAVSSEGKK